MLPSMPPPTINKNDVQDCHRGWQFWYPGGYQISRWLRNGHARQWSNDERASQLPSSAAGEGSNMSLLSIARIDLYHPIPSWCVIWIICILQLGAVSEFFMKAMLQVASLAVAARSFYPAGFAANWAKSLNTARISYGQSVYLLLLKLWLLNYDYDS